MSGYQPLLHVEFNHDYFTDKQCHKLKLLACDKTKHLMGNCDVLMQSTNNGFALYANSHDCEALALYAEDESEPLTLLVKGFCKDNNFSYYTEPEVLSAKGILFFERQDLDNSDSNSLTLHKGDVVSESDFKAFEDCRAEGFELTAGIKSGPQALFAVVLRITSADIDEFIKRVDSTQNSSATSDAPTYKVHFAAAQTLWKYFFIGELFDDTMFIVDLDNKVEFEQADVETFANGSTAMTYYSKQILGLQEHSPYRFQLRNKASGRNGTASRILIKRLPVATAKDCYREVMQGKPTRISEIYINS